MKFKRHCPANHGAQAMREHLHQHYLQHVESVEEPRRFHRLRKRLFWQIYVVVISSVLLVSALSGLLLHLRAQGVTHIPIIPLLMLTALVVSLGAYPIARRLTYRLEQLRQSVEALGEGKLETRMTVKGCDEVAVLASSFNQSAARIQALLAGHRQLLANASHELRSPLARMQMSLAMLAEQQHLENTPAVTAMRQDMRELNQLVEEILLASRLDTLEIPLESQPVDLAALLVEECARVAADCEAQTLQVMGDERLLRRLIRNLLENARRHGGGDVIARLFSPAADSVTLQVLDRGAGIPPAAQAHVFEPFYRPAGHGEAQGGWGLGLSLVKQIATRHGGSVVCQARDGGGTVFAVELPALA
ncbi:MAG: HAMP domain-containing sensor histidine kinase [Thiothrix sp.]|uniref:sensor histidine kinase n=1 Tax=Thiothrix sp. TaxID=1032 RepID=UPI002631FD44|nr:HAMP domain-containing sensor histidine kinase [Thiothrix sp.]MDD5394784.1 HAMP domain-containing sensor histidine kinase [Thiothrix sp.]